MLEQTMELVKGLRSAGVTVGTSEFIDAIQALGATDNLERRAVYALLRSALVKEQRFLKVFDLLFAQIFYASGSMNPSDSSQDLRQRLDEAVWSAEPETVYQQLAEELIQKYLQPREIIFASDIQWTDMIAKRIVARTGLKSEMSGGNLTGQSQSDKLLSAVRRQLAGYQYQQRKNRGFILPDADSLRNLSFFRATPEQQQELRILIRQLAKKVATQSAGKRRGGNDKLNFRRLWRKSLSYGGIPLELCWEYPPKKKTQLFVLLDVSRSMSRLLSFFLELVYALCDEFSNIRVFLFISSLTEVTQQIERDDLNDSLNRVLSQGVQSLGGSTDYGGSLENFCENYLDELTGKSTVIVLGDGRNNNFPTREENLLEMKRRCSGLFWLNPESSWQWGTGDSVMDVYLPYCDGVYECRNLAQLEKFIEQLILKR